MNVTARLVSLAALLALSALPGLGCDHRAAADDVLGSAADPLRWEGAIEGQSVAEQLADGTWRCHPVDASTDTWYGCLAPAPAPTDVEDPKYASFDGIQCVPAAGRVRQVEGGVLLQLAPLCAGNTFLQGVRLPPNQVIWQLEVLLPPAAQVVDVTQDLGLVDGAAWALRELGTFHSSVDPEQPCPVDVVVGENAEGDETVSCPAADLWTFSGRAATGSPRPGAPTLRLASLGSSAGERVALVLGLELCARWDSPPAWTDGVDDLHCRTYDVSPTLDTLVGQSGELLQGLTGVADLP